jgi:membrane associated rhomboid family serine protease
MLEFFIAPTIIILFTAICSLRGWNDRLFFERYKFQIDAVKSGERERILTSCFLHIDFTHFFTYSVILFFSAEIVIKSIGNLGFLIMYFTSPIIGGILTIIVNKNYPEYSVVGMGTSVNSVLFSSILLNGNKKFLFIFFNIEIPIFYLGILFFLYSIYGFYENNVATNPKTGGAHSFVSNLGGIFIGITITLILKPELFLSYITLTFLILSFVSIVLLNRNSKRTKKEIN